VGRQSRRNAWNKTQRGPTSGHSVSSIGLNYVFPSHNQIFMIALGNTLFPQSNCQI
jgi:hypothetical protein